MERNKKFLSIHPLLTFITPLIIKHFTDEEIPDCTNEAAKGDNKAPRSLHSYFFISYFTVSITPSNDTPESPNVFIILIISFEIIIHVIFLLEQLLFDLFFIQICLLHLKLNCLLIQVNYL